MIEFTAQDVYIAEQRQEEYQPIGLSSVMYAADLIDGIIEHTVGRRVASASNEQLSQWAENTIPLCHEPLTDKNYWPLAQLRIAIRHDRFFEEMYAGDQYNIIVEWAALRPDLKDPSSIKNYKLMIPADLAEEAPGLMMTYQPSHILGPNKGFADIGNNDSNEHEVDTLLHKNFYQYWNQGTEYDLAQLMDELAPMYAALTEPPQG